MEKKGYLEMSVECKLALLKVINLLFVKIILIKKITLTPSGWIGKQLESRNFYC